VKGNMYSLWGSKRKQITLGYSLRICCSHTWWNSGFSKTSTCKSI